MALFGGVIVTLAAESLWIRVVYAQFPQLQDRPEGVRRPTPEIGSWWRRDSEAWKEFSRLPIFASRCSGAVVANDRFFGHRFDLFDDSFLR